MEKGGVAMAGHLGHVAVGDGEKQCDGQHARHANELRSPANERGESGVTYLPHAWAIPGICV